MVTKNTKNRTPGPPPPLIKTLPKFYHFLVASLIHYIPTTGKVHLGADSGVDYDAEVEGGVAHHHLQAPHALRVEGAHEQVLQDARHLCRRLLVKEFFLSDFLLREDIL